MGIPCNNLGVAEYTDCISVECPDMTLKNLMVRLQ